VTELKLTIEHYRSKAAEAESLAREAGSETLRAAYLDAARAWQDLAQMAEELIRHSRR
jgi:hypothetical protein